MNKILHWDRLNKAYWTENMANHDRLNIISWLCWNGWGSSMSLTYTWPVWRSKHQTLLHILWLEWVWFGNGQLIQTLNFCTSISHGWRGTGWIPGCYLLYPLAHLMQNFWMHLIVAVLQHFGKFSMKLLFRKTAEHVSYLLIPLDLLDRFTNWHCRLTIRGLDCTQFDVAEW